MLSVNIQLLLISEDQGKCSVRGVQRRDRSKSRENDPEITTVEMTISGKFSERTSYIILHNKLSVRKVCARWILRLLTCE